MCPSIVFRRILSKICSLQLSYQLKLFYAQLQEITWKMQKCFQSHDSTLSFNIITDQTEVCQLEASRFGAESEILGSAVS